MGKDKDNLYGKKFYLHPVSNNYAASKDGEIINLKRKIPFRGNLSNSGYLHFVIGLEKNKVQNYCSHRFIWEAIKGPIPENYQIDHIDDCKTNNSIYNLQLLTPKENQNKSHNRKVIAFNLETDETIFISLKIAG